MKNRFLILFGALILLGSPLLSQAQTTSPNLKETFTTNRSKDLDLTADFYMGAFGFKEAQDESQLVQFSFRPIGQYRITDHFGVRGDLQLNLTTGRSQTRFQNPNFNFMNIQEMVAFYEPAPYFQLQAGAINQNHFANRMFIADRGFPGLVIKTGYQSEKFSIQPKAQYAVPSSTSFESERTQAEALPALTTLGIEAWWQVRDSVKLEANVNQFTYSQLPSVVAFQSSRFGNSTIGTDPSESFFRYDFQGISQAYTLEVQYTADLQQNFHVGIIENSKAPADRRRSQMVGTSFDFNFFTELRITPSYSVFFAESDSVPAIYSAFELGRNNREGQVVGLEVDFKKLGVALKANYIESAPIEQRPLQANMQIFDFALEFKNVVL